MNRLKHAHLKVPRILDKEPLTEDIRKKTFSEEELQTIISQRPSLLAKNLADYEISKELSKLIGHPAGSIDAKIRKLVKSGQLPDNTNKREHEVFTAQELQTITSQRSLLIAKNLTDHVISRELSKLIGHPATSIDSKIRNLVKSAQLSENPNKQEREVFTAQELQTITSQRPLLISKNLTDREISRELSKLIDHPAGCIDAKIRRLVMSSQLPENPNKQEQEDFSDQELETIISQRPSLIAKNLTDGEISRRLSKPLNRSAGGIKEKVRNLVKSGHLPENPNKMKDFDEEELQTIISQRPLLIAKNLTDRGISRELSKQLNRSAGGIKEKVRRLVESGKLPENPNKRGRNLSDSELLGQLTDAVDTYTGEKNE